MHPWKARLAHVSVSGDVPQWCLDNGEGDLIPCGSQSPGKERAEQLAETLNSGLVAKLRGVAGKVAGKSVMEAATAIEAKTHTIEQLLQACLPPDAATLNPKVKELYLKLSEVHDDSMKLMEALVSLR